LKSHIKIEDLVAHKPPMILLDTVLDWQSNFIRTDLTIRANSPFFCDGCVPSYVAIEYMAQTVAAYSGLKNKEKGNPIRLGFLLGTRQLKLVDTVFERNQYLIVEASSLYDDGEMGAFECRVLRDEQNVAEAVLNVYQPSNDDQLKEILSNE